MNPTTELFLLSLRKQTLIGEVNRFHVRIDRNERAIKEIESRARELNGELKEQQIQNYKFGKA